jgi:glutathione S-transferase
MIDEMFKRPPPERRGILGWGSYNDVIDTIERALDPGPYLLGDAFSAADVYIGAELTWAGMFGAPRLKESRPISEYVARCTRRPAYLRTQPSVSARNMP